MEIGLFQLENLTISRSPFTFLDLRADRSRALPDQLQNCVKVARPTPPEQVEEFLTKESGPKDRPILLMCENGKISAATADRLESAGYANVYIVAGGVDGLLSELD